MAAKKLNKRFDEEEDSIARDIWRFVTISTAGGIKKQTGVAAYYVWDGSGLSGWERGMVVRLVGEEVLDYTPESKFVKGGMVKLNPYFTYIP